MSFDTNANLNRVKFAAITTVFPVLLRIRISGSVLLSYGYGSGSGSCSFRQWLSRCQPKKIFFLSFLFTETRDLLYLKLPIVKDDTTMRSNCTSHYPETVYLKSVTVPRDLRPQVFS